MKQVISIIITAFALVGFAKDTLVERALEKDPSGKFTVRILAPEDDEALDYQKTVPLIVEYIFPDFDVDGTFPPPPPDLDFRESLSFDCDQQPTVTPFNRTNEGLKGRYCYELEPLQPPYEIPAVTVTFKDAEGNAVTVTTQPFTINIADANLSEDTNDDYLAPVDPPGMDRQDLLRLLAWCGGALLVLALIGGSLWRTLHRRRMAAAAPQLTPYEIAQRDLTALLAEKLPESGEYKRFYQRISGILRDYLENRFGVKAPRLTTEEFLRLLTSTPELVREHRELLQKFLTACDLVKFAAQVPDSPQINEITTSCRTFLDATQPPPPPTAT